MMDVLSQWFKEWALGKDIPDQTAFTFEQSERLRLDEEKRNWQEYVQMCYATLEASRSAQAVMATPFWHTMEALMMRHDTFCAHQALNAKNYEEVLLARGEVRGVQFLKRHFATLLKAGEQAAAELAKARTASPTP